MPSIPKTQQYYPTVPISELTDLYSKGANTLAGKKIFIASYLSKTLRLSEDLPFSNHYTLFIEDTPVVAGIEWGFQLYSKGAPITLADFVTIIPSNEETHYSLFFSKDSVDALGIPLADKLKITCTVEAVGENVELVVEHDLVQLLTTEALNNEEEALDSKSPHQGNPETTKYVVNHLKDYLPNGQITWNDETIETDGSAENENNLLKIVIGIIYYNVQVSINDTIGFDFLYNINQDRNEGIEVFLNDEKKNKGDYTNGLCRIPLHVLNEILIDFSNVPSFTDMNEGDGHQILNILSGAGTARTDEKIQASQLKLEEDEARYIELFNLTNFPKSSIKLCALVVKYLLESSKKNECKECKNKRTTWKDLTIDELSTNTKFVWNILTLYYDGPTHKVKKYSRNAIKTKDLIWSPFTDLIVNVAPRIVKAYFAKRVIKRLDDELIGGIASPVYTFEFERIDNQQTRVDVNEVPLGDQPDYEAILGREIYLIVETLNIRGKELTLNVKPNDLTFNGNRASIELQHGIAGEYSTDIVCSIGNHGDLVTNTLAPFSPAINEYLDIDYKDKAMVKIRLKPENTATFNAWATHLSLNTGNLMIEGKLTDETDCYFGNDFSETRIEGEFLSDNDNYMSAEFRVVNRIVYEMYKDDNPWNFLPAAGLDRSLIATVNNQFVLDIENGEPEQVVRKALYFYYDELDYEHFFGEFDIERNPDWNQRNNAPPVDMINTVQISDLDEYDHRGVHIGINQTSARDFANMACYAGLLAAMAVNNVHYLTTTGFSLANGSPQPSESHINGEKGDLRYLRTDRSGGPCILTQVEFDRPMQTTFNNSLHQYGWGRTSDMISENVMIGGVQTILPHCRHFHRTRIDVSYHTEDVVVAQNYPQRITANPRGGVLNVGDQINLNGNNFTAGGILYNSGIVNRRREIIAPLPPGATLAVGTRINSPVRHNNHLQIQGNDPYIVHEHI